MTINFVRSISIDLVKSKWEIIGIRVQLLLLFLGDSVRSHVSKKRGKARFTWNMDSIKLNDWFDR